MILFFANNRDSQTYFQKVADTLSENAVVYYEKPLASLEIQAFFTAPMDVINQAIHFKDTERKVLSGSGLNLMQSKLLELRARWYYAKDIALLKRSMPKAVVVWNGLMFRRSMFVAAARSLGIKTVFMENGLLPDTTVCDSMGINANNSVPRYAEFFRQLDVAQMDDKVDLVVREAKQPKKSSGKQLPERFIFVPFQVDTDSQIIIFSPWIKTMKQLFDAMLKAVNGSGELKLVFKEHPSSKIDYAFLHNELPDEIGIFANEYSTQELIEQSEAVVTINSTVGIESLLYGKKVIVLGQAFFNIPGLVLSANGEKSLTECIRLIPDFRLDEQLRKNFLGYLQHDYLIAGSWRSSTPEHCKSVANRIMDICDA